MGLYSDVFNRAKIYNLLFFNIKTITEKSSFEYLNDNQRLLWERLSSKQYPNEILVDTYRKYGVFYPEFSKIIGLSYGYVSVGEDGNLKRELKQVINMNEGIIIETFFDILNQAAVLAKNPVNGVQPKNILCGHNIIDYDIPFLLKRFMVNKLKGNNFSDKNIVIPELIKKALDNKPWESSSVIDTSTVWKFNSYSGGKAPLESIVETLDLKRNVVMLPIEEVSSYYWKNIEIQPQETLKNIGLQALNTVNCVIQLMNEFRRL